MSSKQPKGIIESVQAESGPATNAFPIIATGLPSVNKPAPPFPLDVNILYDSNIFLFFKTNDLS